MDTMFKAAFVTGIDDALVDAGIYQWPNEEVRLELTAKIAEEIGGGPQLEQYQVPREGVTFVADRLIKTANYLQAQGYRPTNEQLKLTKQAAQYDLNTRAAVRAEEWMKIAAYLKQAEQESLTQVGKNTPEESAGNDQTGRLDWNNRPEGKYNLGFGKTNFPDGGVVGKQMFTEEKASGRSKDNSLQHLDKQANELLAQFPDGRLKIAATKIANDPSIMSEKLPLIRTLLDEAKHVSRKGFEGAKNLGARGLEAAKNAPGAAWEQLKKVPGVVSDAASSAGSAISSGAGTLGEGAKNVFYTAPSELPSALRSVTQDLAAGRMGENPGLLTKIKAYGDPLLHGVGRPVGALAAAAGTAYGAKKLHDYLTDDQEKNSQLISKFASNGAIAMQAFDRVLPGAMKSKLAHYVMAGIYEHAPNPDAVAFKLIEMTKQANDEGMSPEDILQQILQQQGEVGEQASPELIAAIQQALAEQGDEGMAEETAEAPPPENPNAMPPKEAANKLAELANARKANSSSNLLDRLKRAADGSLTNSSENTPGEAAKDDQTAALDQKNRPEGKYNKGFGNTDLKSPGQGYTQKKAPGADTANTQNSLTPSEKEAADEYDSNLRKVANAYADQLPAHLSRNEKIAHLQHMLSLPPHQRVPYVKSLF